MKPQSCPHCQGAMALRQTRAHAEAGGQFTYYFLSCSECGEGPNKAFASADQAIVSWNQLAGVVTHHAAEECVA